MSVENKTQLQAYGHPSQPDLNAGPSPIDEVLEQHSEDPRQALVDDVLSPYHIHYADGVEGAQINPEASERNFDTLLVLTKLIREKRTTQKVDNRKAHSLWLEDADIDWYFTKYEHQGVTKGQFDQPKKVVSLWLHKLGPHNDMADATEDLLAARQWLIQENEAKTAAIKDPSEKLRSKEYGVIADIDMELGEVVDNIDQLTLLGEAAAYLDHYVTQQEAAGNTHTAAIARMKLTSVRIETQRLKILGTNQLTTGYSEEQYAQLEDSVEAELSSLTTYFGGATKQTHERFNTDTYVNLAEDEAQKKDKKYIETIGALFEVYSYLQIMGDIVTHEDLAVQRFRPGTIREESSTAHKIDDHPTTRQLKQPDGSVITLPDHGFNYNFDFVLTALDTKHRPGNGGIFHTVYFQNKINPDLAPSDKAREASQKFIAGKQFYFLEPNSLIDHFRLGSSPRETLDGMLAVMQRTTRQSVEEFSSSATTASGSGDATESPNS